MSADYLDLLLTRETRAAPLAEPRIASVAAALVPSPIWGEIAEQRVVRERPPLAAERGEFDGGPPRTAVASPARDDPEVFPPRLDEHIEHAAVPVPPTRADEALPQAAAKNAQPDHQSVEVPIHTEPARTESMRPQAKAAAPAPEPVQTERWLPPPRLRPPGDQLEIPTRPVDSRTTPPPPQPAAQPVIIRIDRIEVRAASPAAPPAPPKPRPTRLGLDDYLKRRSGGGR